MELALWCLIPLLVVILPLSIKLFKSYTYVNKMREQRFFKESKGSWRSKAKQLAQQGLPEEFRQEMWREALQRALKGNDRVDAELSARQKNTFVCTICGKPSKQLAIVKKSAGSWQSTDKPQDLVQCSVCKAWMCAKHQKKCRFCKGIVCPNDVETDICRECAEGKRG